MAVLAPVPEKTKEIMGLIVAMKDRLADVLPKHVTPERMTRLCRQMVSRQPALAECTPISLLDGIMGCGILGLEPNGPLGHAYLVPFKNSKTSQKEATLIVGYQGYIELAYRSGKVGSLWSEIVYAKDYFKRELGTEHKIEHRPAEGDRGEMVGVYAVAEVMGGGKPWVYLTKDEVMRAKASSRGADSDRSPWNNPDTEPDMWRKTAVRRLQKYIPKSIEMARADQAEFKAEMGERQFIEAEVVDATTTGAADLAQKVAAAKAKQAPKQQVPTLPDDAPTPDDEPVPFYPESPVPEEEPPPPDEPAIPFVPFDSLGGLAVGAEFSTQARIKTIYPPRKSPTSGKCGPTVLVLTDGATERKFQSWHKLEGVAVGQSIVIAKARVEQPYNGEPRFQVLEVAQ